MKTQILCLQHILRGGANEEAFGKHWLWMFPDVSWMFPRWRTQATYLKDAEFASQKQKMFCFCPVCSPRQHCEQHWLKMFLQQCFLVCAGLQLQPNEWSKRLLSLTFLNNLLSMVEMRWRLIHCGKYIKFTFLAFNEFLRLLKTIKIFRTVSAVLLVYEKYQTAGKGAVRIISRAGHVFTPAGKIISHNANRLKESERARIETQSKKKTTKI